MQQPRARVTIRDVAEHAGVSVATVSKVINQRYGVAADTMARVQAVISELGYEASLVAQSLRNHHTNVIGILVADLEPFSTELLKGAADAIRGSGFELVVYSAGGRTGDVVGWERRYLSRLSGTLIDGAVLVTPTVVDAEHGAPVVAVDPHTGSSDFPTVDADSLRGGRLATEHLLGLGHRRIALLAGRPDLQSATLREQGYRDALAAAGIPFADSLVRVGGYDAELSKLAAHELLTSPQRADRGVRRQRRHGDRDDRGRAGPRPAGARGRVGRRFRQHPRVGAVHSAADHRQPAHPDDGRARGGDADPADPQAARGAHAPDAGHGAGRARVDRPAAKRDLNSTAP